VEKLGTPQTPAKDCVLCTPAFHFNDRDPREMKIALQMGIVYSWDSSLYL